VRGSAVRGAFGLLAERGLRGGLGMARWALAGVDLSWLTTAAAVLEVIGEVCPVVEPRVPMTTGAWIAVGVIALVLVGMAVAATR
jgi:hypothetical protein